MLVGAGEAMVILIAELLIIFSSEAATRHFRNRDARRLTWILAVVFLAVVILFVLQKRPYLLCTYTLLLCYRLITGVTSNEHGSYPGYTVSKPLASFSTVDDEDIEVLHDSKGARRTQAMYEPPRSQFKTPTQQQPCLENYAPKSGHVPVWRGAAESTKESPVGTWGKAGTGTAKARSVQSRSTPLTSSFSPSSTLSFAPPPAPPGLVNLGNTCFVNAVLQCLTWVPAFIDLLKCEPPEGMDAAFLRSLQHTLEQCREMGRKQKQVDPTPLLQALSGRASHLVKPPKGSTHQGQQDAAEFLLWLLDYLHTIFMHQKAENDNLKRCREEILRTLDDKKVELSKAKSKDLPSYQNCLTVMSETNWELHLEKNSSSIYSHFLGQVMEARECQGCNRMSANFEYFTVFPIPMVTCNSSRPLEECLSLFVEEEKLDKTNMLRCSCNELKLVAGRRIALVSHLPRNLILALKRFSYDVASGSIIKNNASISVPLTLNLQPYTLCNHLQGADDKPLPYRLQALCLHTGAQSTSSGHYIAYSCVSSSSLPVTQNHTSNSTDSPSRASGQSSQWYCFNDTSVRLVRDMDDELKSTRLLENAYLLFYSAS